MNSIKIKSFLKILIIPVIFTGFLCCNDDPTGNLGNSNSTTPSGEFVENFGNQYNSDFFGRVVDLQNNPISGVMIEIGDSSTETDNNGIFILKNAQVYEKFAYVKAEKAGFINGSRALVPTTGVNHVKITLLPMTVTETVNSGVVSTVSLGNGASVELTGEYSLSDGSIHEGNVQVTLHFLNPSDENMVNQMPGMLLAQNLQNEARMLETLGMLAIELRSDSGEKLNLKEGTQATISIPLDPETLNGAPNEIPLWYFDETNGYWIEEGSATLQGSNYVGNVSHFSFWNCDIPTEYVNICLNITDVNNNPISNIQVSIESELNGTGYGITNENGEVCGIVPANQILNLNYFLNGICNNQEIPNSSQSIGPLSQDTTIDIVLDMPEVEEYFETITGQFNTCSGGNVVNGYIQGSIEGGETFYSLVSDGDFEINILSCNENSNLSIAGYDYDNLQTTGEINYTLTSPLTDLGVLSACDSVDEFIQYSIDGGAVEYIFSDFYIDASFDLDIQYFGENNNDWENCFWLRISLNPNYPNYEGEYQFGYQSNNETFYFVENCPIYPNTNENEIVLNLNSFGNAIDEYIDINFGGAYLDDQGNPHTITGVIHVKRDN